MKMNSTPVGLSRDLAAKRVMRAEVEGQDVAIWRGPDGELNAWNNRCPHRGMRLSHGFVRGDKLACLYHGWHYGKDGGCAYIPAHPDLEPPPTIAAVVYHVAEAAGVIWVKTDVPPQVPDVEHSLTPLRSLIFSCSVETALASIEATPFDGKFPVLKGGGTYDVGGLRVALHPSPFTHGTTLVSVTVDAKADLTALKALSRWCEAARRHAEAQAA